MSYYKVFAREVNLGHAVVVVHVITMVVVVVVVLFGGLVWGCCRCGGEESLEAPRILD